MTTKDCIDFIEKQNIDGITPGFKWKRVSKSKDTEKNEIRVFENSNLDKVTLKEDAKNGVLSIVEICLAPNTDVLNTLFEKPTDIMKTFIDNIDILAEITFNAEYVFNDNVFGEDILKYQSEEFRKTTTEEFKQDYLAEIADAKSKEQLDVLCYSFLHYLAVQQRKQPNLNSKISEQLNVLFDFENLEIEVKHLPADINKNFDIIVGYAGGDWEYPVDFAVFWDNQAQCPCMYVPSEKFNLYNRKFMTAYGSEQDNTLGLKITEKDEEEIETFLENQSHKIRTKETLLSLQNYLINKIS